MGRAERGRTAPSVHESFQETVLVGTAFFGVGREADKKKAAPEDTDAAGRRK